MNNMIRKIFYAFWLLGTWNLSSAQVQPEVCRESLKNVFLKMNSYSAPPPGKVYFVDYSVKTVFKDKNIRPTDARVKMYNGYGQTRILSDFVSVYKDKDESYTLIPSRKIIQISSTPKDGSEEIKKADPMELQRLFINRGTVKSCKESTDNGGRYDMEIEIVLHEEDKKKYSINEVKYQIRASDSTLYKAFVSYSSASGMTKMEFTYHSIDLDHTYEGLATPVNSVFYTNEKTLRPEYKGFKVIDQRNKTSNE